MDISDEVKYIKYKFEELAVHFEQALGDISYFKFDISDEVKEQVNIHYCKFLVLCFFLASLFLHKYTPFGILELMKDPVIICTGQVCA